MQGHRLRLTGSEVNTLLKLELLLKDVRARQQLQAGQEEAEAVEQEGGAALHKLGAFLEELLV
jgi:hypothetical protein